MSHCCALQKELNLDFVKFHHLFLTIGICFYELYVETHILGSIQHIRTKWTETNGEWVRKNDTVNTNLADFCFAHTIAHVSEGKKLSGSSPGIDNSARKY